MSRLLTVALHASLCLTLFGCASNSVRGLEKVGRGMDKDTVLNLAGDPKFTFRANDLDHWVYVYTVDNRQWKRDVVFDKGIVTEIARRQSKEEWQKDLEQTDSMEEFEKKARAHEATKAKGKFESVDGAGDASPKGQ